MSGSGSDASAPAPPCAENLPRITALLAGSFATRFNSVMSFLHNSTVEAATS